MKLLLHVCCAPCLIYPLEVLRAEGFNVSLYFFNPNIDTEEEYERRLNEVRKYAFDSGIELSIHPYDPSPFVRRSQSDLKEGCKLCYDIRLSEAARLAKQESFDAFTTTLLVSPYQDQEAIKAIGQTLAGKEGVDFEFKDFKVGFRSAQNRARELGMYMQKYCGCAFSKAERR